MANAEKKDEPIYTYNLKPKLRHQLTFLLDLNQEWSKLADETHEITPDDFHMLVTTAEYGGSPTRKLFDIMDRLKKTIIFLYEKLVFIRNKRAADLLEQHVPKHIRRNKEGDNQFERQQEDQQSLVPPLDDDISSMGSAPDFSRQGKSLDLSAQSPSYPSHSEAWRQNPSSIGLQHQTIQQYNRTANRITDNLASMHLEAKPINKSGLTEFYQACQRSSYPPHREPIESPDQDTSCLVTNSNKIVMERNLSESTNSNNLTDSSNAFALLQEFPYESIREGTNDFADNYLIGKGAFGKVYRGTLRKTTFAIKVFSEGMVLIDESTHKRVLTEIEALSKFRHKNIVQLCGFCSHPTLCLVYEYMINGSLEDKLACKCTSIDQKLSKPLTWPDRSKILRGAARGLFYLHDSTPPLVHGDMKSTNILLDKDFEPKIADFGLAKATTAGSGASGILTHVQTNRMIETQSLVGSRAFLPIEYMRDKKYNLKTDVFSFGVIIYEVCTARKAEHTVNKSSDGEFLHEAVAEAKLVYDTDKDDTPLQKLKDPEAMDWADEFWLRVIAVGARCTKKKKVPTATLR